MSVSTPIVSVLPKGTAYSRLLMALGVGHGDTYTTRVAAEQFKSTPQVFAVIEGWHTKAAVAPGTTTDATYAGPLVGYGIAAEALALERGTSIIGALEPKMRRVPFKTKPAVETGAGTGGTWVAEGNSTPVAKTAYAASAQEAYKAQVISVLTRELLLLGNPSAERTVRETTTAGVTAFLDGQFLDPTITLIANTRPASITNGASAITTTGTTAAQMTTDLNAMLATITTAGSGLTWVMKPITAYRIAATLGSATAADIPRSLFGIPMVLSLNSPQQITLVDASQIFYSDDGNIDIETSDEATIQMDTAPTDPAVAGTVFQSLWDNNLWAVKVTRWLAYLRARSGSVAYMTVTY